MSTETSQLCLTGDAMDTLDPITFEVIKHRLWAINDEQALAIKTISSSPIVVEGNDFNVGLFTADGQLASAGIGSLVHVGTMGTSIRNIMARAGEIGDGDMFLLNDPFLGALHQNDVVIASPLYDDGELLMWVANVLHHPDVGGSDEGSFCISARTLYQDPPRFFMKIVREGRLVPEAEHTFVTNSRLPEMVALDLRAQIGAINACKKRLRALIAERGAATVRGVMQRAIDIAEAQVRGKLRQIPDGSWHGEAWMDGVRVGADELVRVVVALTRTGDKLVFDWTGSDAQVDAAVNSTEHATLAGTSVPLYSFLCQGDIDWNEGLLRCIEVIAPAGSVVNATFPAPVSICTVGFRWLVTVAAAQAVARMFDATPAFRDRVCSSWNVASNCNNVFGIGRDGKRAGALLSDHRGGGAAARSFGDGFSHAGQITSFSANLGNVEGTEWKLPVLYLYRRQLPDSGGPGAYRGGLTSMAAVMAYGTDSLILKSTNTAGTDQSNAHGIAGGYPGAGSQAMIVRDSHAKANLAAHGQLMSLDDLGGDITVLPSKASAILGPDDVLAFYPPGGGGYGDPLDRDPARVAGDVVNGWVSRNEAEAAFGVVFGDDGELHHASTERLRAELRAGRTKRAVGDRGTEIKACDCPAGATAAVVRRRRPLRAAGPWIGLRYGGESPNFSLEELACGACGRLLDVSEVRA